LYLFQYACSRLAPCGLSLDHTCLEIVPPIQGPFSTLSSPW